MQSTRFAVPAPAATVSCQLHVHTAQLADSARPTIDRHSIAECYPKEPGTRLVRRAMRCQSGCAKRCAATAFGWKTARRARYFEAPSPPPSAPLHARLSTMIHAGVAHSCATLLAAILTVCMLPAVTGSGAPSTHAVATAAELAATAATTAASTALTVLAPSPPPAASPAASTTGSESGECTAPQLCVCPACRPAVAACAWDGALAALAVRRI